MKKINTMGKLLAEIVKEAILDAGRAGVLIGDVEMSLRESLREIGQSALKCILANGAGTIEAEIEYDCDGKLQHQQQRAATIGSVFGKVTYTRTYYAGCAILDRRHEGLA